MVHLIELLSISLFHNLARELFDPPESLEISGENGDDVIDAAGLAQAR
jgi:hypothetical protein